MAETLLSGPLEGTSQSKSEPISSALNTDQTSPENMMQVAQPAPSHPLQLDEDQEMITEERGIASMLSADNTSVVAGPSTMQNIVSTTPSEATGPAPTDTITPPHHEGNPPTSVTLEESPPEHQTPIVSAPENASVDTQMFTPQTPVADTAECTQDAETETAEDDTQDEDDDMSSEISEGVDLQEELQEALDDSNFEFHGTFYHGSILNSPPNPCLFISGLGLVGLPLSDRDAKSIISCATQAPFGHGERLVVNKDVRDTWEVEASRVSFGNAAWHEYVNKTLCAQLCNSLGVNIGANLPRMELYKLLLYETGSHFLPHQDTQKADGMFATAIVLLPSAFTGGQVIVSHASTSKTIDFANDSLFSMALLAWYTDVKHEVKPITSGYRLALSYNLIHVAPPGVPPPCLPDMRDTTDLLRRVLRKWREDKYESSPDLMAYLLDHQYSPANLSKGLKALQGVDLHRVSFLRPIAEELGFRVGLARLEHNVSGQAEDGGYNYYNRRRRWGGYDEYSDDEDEGETPEMGEVDSTTTTISGLVDLDGHTMVSVGRISVEPESLIPNDPFEDMDPDDTDYEGYMGNYPGQVEHWYRKTAFVIMHEDSVDDVCFSVDGAPYAFRKLQNSTTIPPTADDRRWAMRLLKASRLTKEHILALLDLSLKWKDLELWKLTTSNPACTLTVVDSKILFNAMEMFSFAVACQSFETLLARSTVLAERINFLSHLPSKAPPTEKDAVSTWYQREVAKILSSYKPTNVQDIPNILVMIRLFGLKAFIKIVMPNITKNKGNYAFCIAFMKSLLENQQKIIEQETSRTTQNPLPEVGDPSLPSTTTGDAVKAMIKQCLQAALAQWNDVPASYAAPYYSHHLYGRPAVNTAQKVDRAIEIIEQAIATSEMDICKTLFIDLLKISDTTAKKFQDVYIPMIPRLRALLATKGLNLSQPPFVDFIQLVIGLYLRDILGKKGQLSTTHLRNIGCGCADCKMLDNFIFDLSKTTTTIRIVQARRVHLEKQAAAARDLVTYETIRYGSPHGIQLTKLPAVVEASTWVSRQKAAKTFLTSIGSEDDIKRIMGVRYNDLKYAIDGMRSFGSASTVPITISSASTSADTVPAATAAVAAATATRVNTTATNPVPNPVQNQTNRVTNMQPVPSSSTTAPVPKPATNPPKLAGTKRKTQPKAHLGTIDLTGDDSS